MNVSCCLLVSFHIFDESPRIPMESHESIFGFDSPAKLMPEKNCKLELAKQFDNRRKYSDGVHLGMPNLFQLFFYKCKLLYEFLFSASCTLLLPIIFP